MRIISGKYKSRRIQVPTNLKARPTTDFAKEGLFNVLNNYIDWDDTSALDLFSGTGSIALELVSRGCSRVVSVESEQLHWRFITIAKEKLEASELYPLKAVDEFVKKLEVQQKNGFKLYWIACGNSDFVYQELPFCFKKMDEIGFKYTYRESDGGHIWRNWRIYLTEFAPMLFK
jgi:16S rRNA (guanine(966)-N(2))-methyltransferase RsmD